jgi:hypothetical protein
MKFFHFNQYNSGGSFDFDKEAGITHHVVIEAADAADANSRAEDIGLYFNGCSDGRDCDCCGDRWSDCHDDGDAEPMVYGEPVASAKHATKWMKAGYETAVHYADGRIEWFA